MSILYFNEDMTFPEIDKAKVSHWVDFVIQEEGYLSGDISVIFCSDDYLLDVNQKYLQHDYYTDIITFDYTEKKMVSGDLFISCDRVKENAAHYQVDFLTELYRIIIHGILHLLGYQDKASEDKKRMTSKEDLYLQKLDQF